MLNMALAMLVCIVSLTTTPEKVPSAARSGKRNNIAVVFVSTSGWAKVDRKDPSGALRFVLDEKGRLFPNEGHYEIETLGKMLAPLFKKDGMADVIVRIESPQSTSFATCRALVDRFSEAVDAKNTLTLYLEFKEK